jgi:hypothetical protein
MSLRHLAPLTAMVLAGCVSSPVSSVAVVQPGRLPGPKVVAFIDSGIPQFSEAGGLRVPLGIRLEAAGFTVKRFVDDDVRYGIDARGAASRCELGGTGVDFAWIEVDIIDLRANRVVHRVSGAGATEGCIVGMDQRTRKAITGTLYSELTAAVAAAWARSAAPSSPASAPPVQGVSL